MIPVLADPQLNTPSRAVTAESKSSTAPRGVQIHYAVLVPQRLYIQAVHRALLTRRCGPILPRMFTLCLNQKARETWDTCANEASWHDTSGPDPFLLSSKAVDFCSAICHSCHLSSQDRPRATYRPGRRFSLRAPLARQRKSQRFQRSYHVLSSNSDHRHSCQTRVPYGRAATAPASAPSGRRPEALTARGGALRPWAFFFPPGQTPSAAETRCSAPSSRASTSPHL